MDNFLGVAFGGGNLPILTWTSNPPELSITFPDGSIDKVSFTMYNPIPVSADELLMPGNLDESFNVVDPCIYIGALQIESEVPVTVTGACKEYPMFKSYEVRLSKLARLKILSKLQCASLFFNSSK